MESPPSQGGLFMSGTQPGTRFAKVLSPGWKGLVMGGETETSAFRFPRIGPVKSPRTRCQSSIPEYKPFMEVQSNFFWVLGRNCGKRNFGLVEKLVP